MYSWYIKTASLPYLLSRVIVIVSLIESVRSIKSKELIESVKINDLDVKIIRKRVKNIYLRLKPPDGAVYLTVPNRTSLKVIKQFIISRLDWIAKHQAQIVKAESLDTKYNYESGEIHSFEGESYVLNVIYGKGQNKILLDKDNKTINLYANKRGVMSLREKIMLNWYKNSIDRLLPSLIHKWQLMIGVSVTGYRLRYMTSRWGSCNINDRNICLNIALAKKPPICLEYVLVHELIHLLERNHNKRFYLLMAKFLPQWQEYEKLLKLK